MALVRTFRLPHYEDYPVHVAMFKDVTNAAFLRSQLLSANPDFDYAFLDATMILSSHQLLLATLLALHSHLAARSKTRTPHSELVFRLHPNNNIGESYRKFGISDDSTHLIAVKLSLSPQVTDESVSKHLGEVISGKPVELGEEGGELGVQADLGKIAKVYKLNNTAETKKGSAVNGATGDQQKHMESVILGIMTLKGS